MNANTSFIKICLFIIIGFISVDNIVSQEIYVNKEWSITNGIINSREFASSAIDNNGNYVLIGNKKTDQFSSILSNRVDSNGGILWEQVETNVSQFDDYGSDIAIDNLNNLYVCGAKHNGINYDYYIAKYSSSGQLMWQKLYNGTGNGDDIPAAITIDNFGNIYVTGGSLGQNSFFDFATIKLNNSGTIIWTKRYDFNNKYDAATDITINNLGEIIVCGGSNTNLANADFVVIKYNSNNGNIINSNRHNTPGNGYDIPIEVLVDLQNNVFVTGVSDIEGNKNVKTISYSFNLQQTNWVEYKDVNGLVDEPRGMTLDNEGELLITGFSERTSSSTEFFIEKRNALNGQLVWEKTSNGFSGSKGNKIKVDQNNNVYVAGEVFEEEMVKMFLASYTSDGKLLFRKTFSKENSSMNKATQLQVKNDQIFVTGISETTSGKELITVKYSFKEKPVDIAFIDGVPSYNKRELVVKFNPLEILVPTIDNKAHEASRLKDFVQESTLEELKKKTGRDWSDFECFKIFRNMTTSETESESRLGKMVKIEEFWSTLSVFIPSEYNEDEAINSLNELKNIINYAEKNYIGMTLDVPNDGLYPLYQSGLKNTSFGINAEQAWDKQTGQTHTKVGVFDYGIDWRHEDFGDGTQSGTKIIGGWDFANNVSPFDQNIFDLGLNNHGSLCAGIVGALRNNSDFFNEEYGGVAGIAGGDFQLGNTGCQLFSMGIGTQEEVSNIIWHTIAASAIVEGAVWTPSYGYGLHIQNHSWSTSNASNILRGAVKTSFKNGCLFVTSSGNSGADCCPTVDAAAYPASYNDEYVLKVGANDNSGSRADFSVYGNYLDVIAPGTSNIFKSTSLMDTYSSANGTSFAAPHAAGIAALMHSEHYVGNGYPNNLAPEDFEYILQESAIDLPPSNYDPQTGHGRVNAKKALDLLSLPLHYVKHLGGQSSNSSEIVQEDFTVLVLNNTNGVAAGYYTADRYWVNNTFVDVFDPSQTVLAHWPLFSSSTSISDSPTIIGDTKYLYAADINQNTITVQTAAFAWLIKYPLGSGQLVNKWIPCPPSELRTYYSVLIENNIEVGLNDLESNDQLKVYPNPTHSKLNIEVELNKKNEVYLEIVDLAGRVVLDNKFGERNEGINKLELDLSNIITGVYVCNIWLGDTQYKTKIMKN